MAVGAQSPAVFVPALPVVLPVGAGQDNAAHRELFPPGIAVVGAIAQEVVGVPAVGRDPRRQRRLDERDFRRRGGGNRDSQRKTLTLDQYHAL